MRRSLVWKLLDKPRIKFADRWQARIRAEFLKEGKAVVAAFTANPTQAGALGPLKGAPARWGALLTELYREASETFGKELALTLGATIVGKRKVKGLGDVSADELPDDLPAWDFYPWTTGYKQACSTIIATKVKGIDGFTRDRIAAVIQNTSPTKGPGAAAAEIKQLYEGFTAHRSWRIARTEGAMAANYATHNAATESGLATTKTWVTSRDSRVRPSHVRLDGSKVGIDDLFPNGLAYPCDPRGDAAEVVHCRCVSVYGYEIPEAEDEPEVAPPAVVSEPAPEPAPEPPTAESEPTFVDHFHEKLGTASFEDTPLSNILEAGAVLREEVYARQADKFEEIARLDKECVAAMLASATHANTRSMTDSSPDPVGSALRQEMFAAQKALRTARQDRRAEHQQVVIDVLREATGGEFADASGLSWKPGVRGKGKAAQAWVSNALETLPAKLVTDVVAKTQVIYPSRMEVKVSSARSHFYVGEFKLTPDEHSTHLHEVGHLIEATVPAVLKKSIEYLESRTVGEAISQIPGQPRGEKGRRDRFSEAYTGKDYSNSYTGKIYATEVLSMGLEGAFFEAHKIAEKDENLMDYVLGTLAGYRQ